MKPESSLSVWPESDKGIFKGFLKDKGKGIKGETAVIVALDGVRRKDVFVD
jgi:hypothetical protein